MVKLKLDRSSNNSIHHYIRRNNKTVDKCMSYLANMNMPKLTDEEKLSCKGSSLKMNAGIALSSMGNKKSPGNDGLSKEFYICFFDEIQNYLFRVTELLIYTRATVTLNAKQL